MASDATVVRPWLAAAVGAVDNDDEAAWGEHRVSFLYVLLREGLVMDADLDALAAAAGRGAFWEKPSSKAVADAVPFAIISNVPRCGSRVDVGSTWAAQFVALPQVRGCALGPALCAEYRRRWGNDPVDPADRDWTWAEAWMHLTAFGVDTVFAELNRRDPDTLPLVGVANPFLGAAPAEAAAGLAHRLLQRARWPVLLTPKLAAHLPVDGIDPAHIASVCARLEKAAAAARSLSGSSLDFDLIHAESKASSLWVRVLTTGYKALSTRMNAC